MDWITLAADCLTARPIIGYREGTEPASEPTALAALALLGCGREDAARQALEWLGSLQQADGSIGVRCREPQPNWPTSLAVVAWTMAAEQLNDRDAYRFSELAHRGIGALLGLQGVVYPPDRMIRHDTTLAAWPWVEGTHAWIEPTALNLIALKTVGQGEHSRAREAVDMLLDRQLPGGGCNYGNKIVLDQVLRPHLQPTGLALLALAAEPDREGRIGRSADWLVRTLSSGTSSLSLSWSVLGLRAQGRALPAAESWLELAADRHLRTGGSHQLALLVLAALGGDSPLVRAVHYNPLADSPQNSIVLQNTNRPSE